MPWEHNTDLNFDGKIDICDFGVLQLAILGKIEIGYICDLNNDGKLDVSDLQILLNKIGEKPVKKVDSKSFQPTYLTYWQKAPYKKDLTIKWKTEIFNDYLLHIKGFSNYPLLDYLKIPLPKSKIYLYLGLMINAPPHVS